MKDPYYYDDVPVLKNLLNIKDAAKLDVAESSITAVRIASVETATHNLPFDFSRLQAIHRHIFAPIYKWAGEIRKINIEKPEKVLNGMSVDYCDFSQIGKEATKIIGSMNKTDWLAMGLDKRAESYAKKVAALWKVHAFREGNTRTVMTFAAQYANENGFPIDETLFKKYASFTRNSLVMASIGEYSEYQHLSKIMRDAMAAGEERERMSDQLQQENDPILEYCHATYKSTDEYKGKSINKSYDLER